MPRPAAHDGLPWLSVRVRAGSGAIDSVGLYVYQPYDTTFRLRPYEVE